MFRMSYRFMAGAGARKGVAKVPKVAKGFAPIKTVTQPNVSILNGPIAPPLRMETPVMPSLDLVSAKGVLKTAAARKPSTKKSAAKTTTTNATKKPVSKPIKKLSAAKPGSKKTTKSKTEKPTASTATTAVPKKPLKIKAIKRKAAPKKAKTGSAPNKSKAKL